MPNHCTNNLTCTSGKDIGTLLKPYLTKGKDEWFLDFNKIIPMPEGILKTVEFSSMGEITKERTPEEREAREKEMELLKKENMEKYGFESWYEWCVEKWGTKWNSYDNWTFQDVNMDEEEKEGYMNLEDVYSISFQTAWSPPLPIVRKLVELTGESFRMSYYDEGWMFGGEFKCGPAGETDDFYNDPDEVPEDSELFEELDCAYHLECRAEEEEED